MASSPLAGSDGPVTLVITSNGTAVPDTAAVLSVATRAEMNRIPEAMLVLEDGDPASQEFPLSDGTLFVPGAEIEIKVGYGDATPATIFKGVVVAMRLKIDGDRAPRLVVDCRDKAFKLALGRRSKVHVSQTDATVISGLVAASAGLTADVAATDITHAELVQYCCSDWDFLLARAEVNGLVVWAEGGKVSVREPDFAVAAALTVTYGIDLIRFDAEVDARSQFASVEAQGWSIADQAAATGHAPGGSANAWGNLSGAALAAVGSLDVWGMETASAMDATALQGMAKARQSRAELARLRGQVRFQGHAGARLGATLELAGLSARFNGTAVICSVLHRIENGTWITDAGLGLDAERGRSSPGAAGAAGLTLPAQGLQIGKVAKLTEDPQSQNHIQVLLPMLGADAKVWARLGGLYMSNGAGVMFLPEVGDEVIVGFFNDDPSCAVLLGSLHSSTLPPPLAATAENAVKTIVTPKKLKVEFDDEKKKITVATPGGNTVLLDDEGKSVTLKDQNGNTLTLAAAGITLDSAGDVTIKASKNVSVQATGDVTLQGLNVKATGQTTFSASGNASAELKAAGTLKVQAALVQIN